MGLSAMDNFLNSEKLAVVVVTVLLPFCWFITRTDSEEDKEAFSTDQEKRPQRSDSVV